MSIDAMKLQATTIQSRQLAGDSSTIVSQADIVIRVIGLMKGICSLLIIVGLIVGIIYMIKSKKATWKKFLIGGAIILVPFIINLILSMVKFNMALNM